MRPLRGSGSCGSGWSVPRVSIQLSLSQVYAFTSTGTQLAPPDCAMLTLLLTLLARTAADEESSCASIIAADIARGDLYAARRAAVAHSSRPDRFHSPLSSNVDASECAAAWRAAIDTLLERPEAMALIASAHRTYAKIVAATPKRVLCADEKWEFCCSSLIELSSCDCACAMGDGSRSYLRLPALREIAVLLRLPSGRFLSIEQDGLLRPFDVPTVLWPAGYLLSLWVADPSQRSKWARPHGLTRVLELGTGTGAAAIAAAFGAADGHSISAVATDVANRSLALVVANAALAGVTNVLVQPLDWYDDASIAAAIADGGPGPFDLVLGAALHFEKWQERLWTVLERLTIAPSTAPDAGDESCAEGGSRGGDHAGSLVALSHTIGAIQSPPLSVAFVEVERVPGAPRYGMTSRWNGESEFEVVLLRRVRRPT